LLVSEIGICRNQDLEIIVLGGIQQITILEFRPAALVGS